MFSRRGRFDAYHVGEKGTLYAVEAEDSLELLRRGVQKIDLNLRTIFALLELQQVLLTYGDLRYALALFNIGL